MRFNSLFITAVFALGLALLINVVPSYGQEKSQPAVSERRQSYQVGSDRVSFAREDAPQGYLFRAEADLPWGNHAQNELDHVVATVFLDSAATPMNAVVQYKPETGTAVPVYLPWRLVAADSAGNRWYEVSVPCTIWMQQNSPLAVIVTVKSKVDTKSTVEAIATGWATN